MQRLVALMACTLAGVLGQSAVAKDALISQQPRILTGHTAEVASVRFSPGGKTLASGSISEEGSVRLWDLQTGQVLMDRVPLDSFDRKGSVNCLEFSPDGKTLAALFSEVFDDNEIALYDTATRKQRAQIDVGRSIDSSMYQLPHPALAGLGGCGGEGGMAVCPCLAFSPDGTLVASGHGLGPPFSAFRDHAGIWDTEGRLRGTLPGHSGGWIGVAFLPPYSQSAAQAGTASSDRRSKNRSRAERVEAASLLTTDGAGKLRLWNAQGQETAKWNIEPYLRTKDKRIVQHVIVQMAVSPDGKTVAIAGNSGIILCLWDLENHKVKRTLSTPVGVMAFSRDGKMLAWNTIYYVQLWDLEADKLIAKIETDKHFTQCLAFSPDGKTLAVAGAALSENMRP